MRPKINIALAVAAVLFVLALSLPETYELALVDGFRGISGDRAIAPNLSSPKSVVNADIIVRNGQSIVKQRAGFTKFGAGLEDFPVGGIFHYDPTNGEDQIVVASGHGLYLYNADADTFESYTSNPLAGDCACTSKSNVVHGIDANWWDLSHRDIDSIDIWDDSSGARITAPIRYMYYDSLIHLNIDWPGSTYATTPCTLRAVYTPPEAELFSDPHKMKRGMMFMDTLMIVTDDERVTYTIDGEGLISSPTGSISSIKYWYDYPYSVVYGYDGQLWGKGDWLQIQDKTQDTMRNLAYYAYSSNSIALSTQFYDELTGSNLSIKNLGSAVTWDTVFKATIAHIDRIDSLRKINGIGYNDYWEFTYHIDSLTDSAGPLSSNDWPIDTLNYPMYREKGGSSGKYMPVVMGRQTEAGEETHNCFVVWDYVHQTSATIPHNYWVGDSVVLLRMVRITNTLDQDTVEAESWDYGLQALLNNRIYYASEDSSEVWYTQEYTHNGVWGSFFINQDDGDQITCLVPLGRNLMVGKKRHLYQCVISSYDNEPDEVVMIESPTGVPSQEAVQEYGGVIYFVSPPHGLFAYNGVNVVNISGPAQFYFADSIAENSEPDLRLKVAIDVTIGTPGVYISYTSKSGTANDRTLRLDLETGQWSKYTNFGASCFAILRGGAGYGDTLLFGTPVDGDSYILKFPSGTKDTAEYVNLEYETGFTNFGTSLELKRYLEYIPLYTAAAAGSLRVSWYVDWSGTATLVDSFASAGGWQAPLRGLDGVQGKAVGFKIQSRSATNVEIGGWELYYQDAGRTDD